jgi:hypothetical protein
VERCGTDLIELSTHHNFELWLPLLSLENASLRRYFILHCSTTERRAREPDGVGRNGVSGELAFVLGRCSPGRGSPQAIACYYILNGHLACRYRVRDETGEEGAKRRQGSAPIRALNL